MNSGQLSRPAGIFRAPALFILFGVSSSLAALSRGIPPVPAFLLAPLLLLGFLLLLPEGNSLPAGFPVFAGGLVVLVSLLGAVSVWRVACPPHIPQEKVSGQGTVIWERSWGGKRAAIVRGPGGRSLLKLSPSMGAREGDRIQFSGFPLPLKSRQGSPFREDIYWRARGVSMEILPESVTVLEAEEMSLSSWRSSLRKRILLGLPPRVRGHLLAALLGVRDPGLEEAHRRWGTAHLLAVSGFHVGIVALGVYRLMTSKRALERMPFPVGVFLSSGVLWIYVLLAGAAPSALRAAFMVQAVLLGRVLGRRGNPLNTVAVAALGLLLWRPEWFWDVGWRLSVMAALVLAALSEAAPSPGWMLLSSPLVWAVTFPQASSVFGQVPLAGILINLAALPVFSVLYPASAVLALPSLLEIPGGYIPAGMAEGLFTLWEWAAHSAAALLPVEIPWSPVGALAGGALFFLILSRGISMSWGKTFAASGLCLLVGSLLFLPLSP